MTTVSALADPGLLRVLVVGGGPSPDHNQAAIESNVRYMLRVLPPGTPSTVLFADGNPKRATVLYDRQSASATSADRLLTLILEGPDAASTDSLRYRAPSLRQVDGAARKPDIASAFRRIGSEGDTTRLLLYFTGHGSPARDSNLDNNVADLWGNGQISVRDLASEIAALPADRPVTLLMVQCFSGAFGNLLFQGGDPSQPLVDRDIVGFFATVKERPAAGCTPAVDEKEYRDFTSYFLAALTGRDRVGRPVSGADYNHDGRVGMDEAYCYALAHDESVDVPVSTSDVFVRRFASTPDAAIFATPYSSLLEWATPAQRAALASLSAQLGLTDSDRAQVAMKRLGERSDRRVAFAGLAAAAVELQAARAEARKALIAHWPALARPGTPGYAEARLEAARAVSRRSSSGPYAAVIDAMRQLDALEQQSYRREIAEARLLRFARLVKTVALSHAIRTDGDAHIRDRYERLVAAEARSPLPRIAQERVTRR